MSYDQIREALVNVNNQRLDLLTTEQLTEIERLSSKICNTIESLKVDREDDEDEDEEWDDPEEDDEEDDDDEED